MHVLTNLALLGTPGSSAFDDMFHLIGIAAIVFAFFKGIQLLRAQPQPTAAPPPAPAPPPAAAAPQPAVAPVVSAGIDPEIVAVIAAAVAVAAPRHRMISIKSQDSLWEKAGRQSVLTSHRIR